MRSRPEIDVKLPSVVVSGERFSVDLLVTSRSVTPIDFIAVDFCVTTGTQSSSNGVFTREEVHRVSAGVAPRGVLHAKVYRHRASFEVLSSLPTSYLGGLIEVAAWIEVHVAIPWWPDVRERHDLTIVAPPIARPRPLALTGSSLRGNEPFVEVSLRAHCFAPGETIEGAVAFGNLGRSRVDDLEAALVGYESCVNPFVSSGRARAEAHRHVAFLAASNEGEGREIPFRIAVPAAASPSFSRAGESLSWMLEARLNLRGAEPRTHRIPITLAVFEGSARAAGAEPIQIGAARWRAVWEEAGAAVGLALDPGKLRLAGEHSGCEVSVSVDEKWANRSSLVARLRFPTWGLALAISGGGAPARAISFPAEEFRRRFHVAGRDLEQVRGALRASLRLALLVFDEARIGDDEAEVWLDAPGHDQPWIGAFLADVLDLARALEEVSCHVPPPSSMAPHVPAWRRFAGDFEAELTVGSMAITGGEFEGAVFEIRPEIEEQAVVATTIELVIDPPIGAIVDSLSPAAIPTLAASIRESFASVAALCRPILGDGATPSPVPEVRAALVSLRLPALIPDPAALRDLMTALLSLAAVLRGDRRVGPYR
jgi:hypothetical protein